MKFEVRSWGWEERSWLAAFGDLLESVPGPITHGRHRSRVVPDTAVAREELSFAAILPGSYLCLDRHHEDGLCKRGLAAPCSLFLDLLIR